MSADAADRAHMEAALALARRGLGTTWPNPSVGAVLVRRGRVVGRGMTAPGGRPHAEALALAAAGAEARGATLYVTLEPCCHHGRAPPCTGALIAAGIARAVVAVADPDRRVNGQGLAALRGAGIAVEVGLGQAEAETVNEGFFAVRTRGRPLVTLKLASTLDGRIATRGGESRWITGEAARRCAHGMRGRHDAVMVGIGTVLADDPDLTCRIAGFRSVPMVRVVIDSHLRLPFTSRLAATAGAAPVWVVHRSGADPRRRAAFASLGVVTIEVAAAPAGVALEAVLAALAQRGLTRVLAEGGAGLAGSLLAGDLVDRLAWFHSAAVMGGDGWPAVQGMGIEKLAGMPRLARLSGRALGADFLSEFARAV